MTQPGRSAQPGRGGALQVRGNWLALAVVGTALIFAVWGGEYSTWNWLTLRREEKKMREEVAQLHEEVDSLRALKKQIEIDPSLQERIAREQFGMIAKGEYLYIIESDSADGE
jgi:cell division protein FtsB